MGKERVFTRFRRASLLVLILIAVAMVGDLLMVDRFLTDQRKDGEIINVAGRQRMLSQRIVKGVAVQSPELESDISEWQARHVWLKDDLAGLPVHRRLLALDSLVFALARAARASEDTGRVGEVDRLSEEFLNGMDSIVDDLTANATRKVNALQSFHRWLTGLSLVVLLLVIGWMLRPLDGRPGDGPR